MNNITEHIRNRRSVRTFDEKVLDKNDIEKLTSFAKTIENPYKLPVNFKFMNAKENVQTADLTVAGFNGKMDEIKVIKFADLTVGETNYFDFPFTYDASKKYKIFLFNSISDSVPLLPSLEIN